MNAFIPKRHWVRTYIIQWYRGAITALLLLLPAGAWARSAGVALSFDDRVRAQEAIERVYYEHRLWPVENPGSKPSFEARMPRVLLEARVREDLQKSAALERYWKRPITTSQLQAEMDRLAASTRDPVLLSEIFAALHNDPSVIAECLARPLLADRLIHSWYAWDNRFHAEVKWEAEALRARLAPETFAMMGGERYRPTDMELALEGTGGESDREAGIWRLDEEDLRLAMDGYPAPGEISAVQETEEAFLIRWTKSKTAGSLTGGELTFPKRPFGSWFEEAARGLPVAAAPSGPYSLPTIARERFLSADYWKEVWGLSASPPMARRFHAAVWTGTEMIIWGGYPATTNAGGRYAPATNSWTATSTGTNCPTPRYFVKAVWTGTEMIVWGGYLGGRLNTGARYDPQTDSWTPTSTGANCPSGRMNHTAVWTGTEMIIWGGSLPTNTGGRYDPVNDTWAPTSTEGDCPSAREQHTAVWTGAEMIVWGGSDTGTYVNTGGRYAPATDQWTALATGGDCPSVRSYHTVAWTGTEMIVWGGKDAVGQLNTGGRYAPSTNTWTAVSTGTGCPSARYLHTAVWTGEEMVVWGGYWNDGTEHQENTGGRYVPASDRWTSTPTDEGCPSARSYHTAVWTGTEMVVWGGWDGTLLDTGGKYNPDADAWSATTTESGSPARRYDHTAVWTGSEMIVWGGTGVGNSGGRYFPATDCWIATSTGAGCPSARSRHTAVWTGTEMIVWGGTGGGAYFNTGGRYDPASDAWSATPLGAGCPVPRNAHTAVWTGTEMIIWGGADASVDFFTGGRYAPATNAWTATSTGAGCPTARSVHTAVWTGTEMIVWGGYWYNGIEHYLNTGGRYVPGTDTWTPTSTGAGCPSGRSRHTAVWTGAEMIVWGGAWYDYGTGSDYYLNTGGRYAPDSNTWTVTSTGTECPSGRVWHTVVWTGTEMIVWGGFLPNVRLSTGGRYAPGTNVWTATSSGAGCPTARSAHTAVWTGMEMIAWGGYSGLVLLNDGGIYISDTPCLPPYGLEVASVEDPDACADTGVQIAWAPDPVDWGDLDSGTRSYSIVRDATVIQAGIPYGTPATTDSTGVNGQYYWYRIRYENGCGAVTLTPGVAMRDAVSPTPVVSGAPSNVCPATTVSLSTGAYAAYQWRFNGTAVPGATERTLEATVSGSYAVQVTDVAGCSGTSVELATAVAFCADSEVSPAGAFFPLRIAKDPSSSTGYALYFQRLDALEGYHLYIGTIGDYYTHGGMGIGRVCDLPVTDLGTGEMRTEPNLTTGDHYYLVTAYGGADEGPSGFDSSGTEIPSDKSTCAP